MRCKHDMISFSIHYFSSSQPRISYCHTYTDLSSPLLNAEMEGSSKEKPRKSSRIASRERRRKAGAIAAASIADSGPKTGDTPIVKAPRVSGPKVSRSGPSLGDRRASGANGGSHGRGGPQFSRSGAFLGDRPGGNLPLPIVPTIRKGTKTKVRIRRSKGKPVKMVTSRKTPVPSVTSDVTNRTVDVLTREYLQGILSNIPNSKTNIPVQQQPTTSNTHDIPTQLAAVQAFVSETETEIDELLTRLYTMKRFLVSTKESLDSNQTELERFY